MTSYKDHPLAFLSSRVTPALLVGRAEDWRAKGFADHGLDVAASLEEAAAEVTRRRGEIEAVADLIEAGAPRPQVDAAILAVDLGAATTGERLWGVGQGLRVGNRDPYGGSVASHIEMAADELRALGAAAEELHAMVETQAPLRAMLEIAAGAVDRLLAAPNHDAPAMRM